MDILLETITLKKISMLVDGWGEEMYLQFEKDSFNIQLPTNPVCAMLEIQINKDHIITYKAPEQEISFDIPPEIFCQIVNFAALDGTIRISFKNKIVTFILLDSYKVIEKTIVLHLTEKNASRRILIEKHFSSFCISYKEIKKIFRDFTDFKYKSDITISYSETKKTPPRLILRCTSGKIISSKPSHESVIKDIDIKTDQTICLALTYLNMVVESINRLETHPSYVEWKIFIPKEQKVIETLSNEEEAQNIISIKLFSETSKVSFTRNTFKPKLTPDTPNVCSISFPVSFIGNIYYYIAPLIDL